MTLIRYVIRSQVMYGVVENLLRDYLPTGQEFVIRNLNALVGTHHRAEVFSLAMPADYLHRDFSAAGSCVESCLEISHNRSYLRNQLMSLGLVFACGSLALLSIGLTAGNVTS